jgi:galactokinase
LARQELTHRSEFRSCSGAGWGGCTVSLLPPSVDIAVFRKALQRRYKPYAKLSDDELRVAVLESKPSPGAGIYKVD